MPPLPPPAPELDADEVEVLVGEVSSPSLQAPIATAKVKRIVWIDRSFMGRIVPRPAR
jgi:hypothetical protein